MKPLLIFIVIMLLPYDQVIAQSPRPVDLRVTAGFGGSDLGGLNSIGIFGGNYAVRLGLEGEVWLSDTIALAGRAVFSEDQAEDDLVGCWSHRRRSYLIEPNVLFSLYFSRVLRLVAGVGIGAARITEGDFEDGLFCGDEVGPEKKRVALTASIPVGAVFHFGRFSLSGLLRLETIGGKTTIGGTQVGTTPEGDPVATEKIESNGLAATFNLGVGLSF